MNENKSGPGESFRETIRREARIGRRRGVISLLVLALIIVGYTVLRPNDRSTLTLSWSETALTITDPAGGVFELAYGDIASMGHEAKWDRGVCVEGGSQGSHDYGIWHNSAYGDYRLYASTACESAIALHARDTTVAISYESDETTHALYESIVEMLEKQGFVISHQSRVSGRPQKASTGLSPVKGPA